MITPSFIPYEELQKIPLEHEWDDSDAYEVIGPSLTEVHSLLWNVSDRCILAFALGCTEWVIARFPEHKYSTIARQYLDAFWLTAIDNNYIHPVELDAVNWRGPTLGPIFYSFANLHDVLMGFDEGNAAVDSAFAERIAMLVLPDATEFIKWRNTILRRMRTHYSVFPPEEHDGEIQAEIIPRDFLDPAIPYDRSNLQELVRKCRSELLIADNPFVIRIPDDYPRS
jgi:hypothetical protein